MDDKLLYQTLLLAILAMALIRPILKLFLIRPKARLPPGPWKLPVIGNMHHLVNVLPHRALRDLARVHGPLMMLQLGETPLVVASSREMARKVLKTHDASFATRPKLLGGEIVLYGWSDITFSPSGEYWRKLRQLCAAEILSPKRVLTFRHIREQEMASEVDRIRAAGLSTPVDLSAMFHNIANSIVARASFGNVQRNADEFLSALKTGVILTSGFKIPDLFPTWRPMLAVVTGMRRALEEVHRTVDTTLEEIIRERKGVRVEKARSGGGVAAEAEEENLVDILIGLQDGGGLGFNLNENTIKAVIFDMFTAGTGTLASALSWGMSELMRNKRVMNKLQGEIRQAFHGKVTVTEADLQSSSLPYLKLVIKETLRLHPPAPLLVPRESIDECEIEDYMVPAKSRVIVNAWAIGRDPKCWEDAEEFKPERFENSTIEFHGNSYEYLPFGGGRRMCPGIAYSIPFLEIVLVQLLYHFNWLLPDGVPEVDMAEAPGLGVRRKSPLLLCATPFAIPESMF
ncbi:Premnaspirodiene oxygenase [Dichanthelium oligosanthes]|uniref:Premnaspirodiene oxygenase n=1 Tax=Dichanthelium oligosanthes TaxID=888268 RepID=A0A1E5URK8_9POAL|nr:Premnaspirodiene oxygenase [Dichanthelium oligosanthes]